MFRDIKPPFGQTNPTTTFGSGGFSGAATANPFGQTFGKTTTTGFAAPAFGSTGTSLFGSSAPTTGGLFGGATATPVFGQAQTTTQPSAFGFTSNTTGTGLFGAQQNAGTGLFGSSGTSAFGQNKPTFGSFGSTGTGLFGQQQQPQQPTQTTPSLFGQTTTNTGTGIFGTGGFGATNTANATIGTPIKFTPVTGTDTMMKNGVTQNISTRHHCITCMKEYESKSLEELRLEDYMANRKGPQQTAQQPSLFGTSTGGSLFGAGASTSTGTGGIFTQDKPLFGSTSMGFGTSTGGVFGSTTQQSGSLFGKPGFGTMTTTTGTGFSFNTTTSANPFGASTQAKPFGTAAPQTGLFGTATSQPSTFGTGTTGFPSFGTQQNQSIGLFNQNKPGFNMATTSSGFGFGTQNTATNTGLFGSKPAGGLGFGTGTFGNTTTPSFGGGNMFGGNQNTSLFSQSFKPASTGFPFGQTTATTTTLGTGLNLGGQSLFGNTANKPGSLFGGNTGMFNSGTFGTTNTFGTGTGLGGMSTNLGGNPLLGGTTANPVANQQNTNSIHQQILSLASMPFGDSPLFRNLLPATGKADELLKPTNPAAQKAILANNQFKVSPRGNARIKVKPLGAAALSKKSLFEGLEEDDVKNVNLTPRTNAKRLQLKANKSVVENSPSTETSERSTEANKENSIVTDKSILEMNNNSWIKECQRKNESNIEEHASPSIVTIPPYSSPGKTNILSNLDPSPSQKTSRSSLNTEDKENSNNSTSSSDDSVEADEPAALIEDQNSHPTGIVLRRVGYYTIPTLDEITEVMNNDGSCILEKFTVGREGYGNIFFPGPLDVAGLNLDEIVHFRHKEVMLYPDDDKKPPVGQGLNRKAQVTLDRVWPMDKTTHQAITDPERLKQMDYEGKLRRVCAKLQTRFLEYRPQTGSWVFKVDHFSKYGLSDSDDDDDLPPTDPKKSKAAVAQQAAQKQPLKDILPNKQQQQKQQQQQEQQQQQQQQSPSREFSLQMPQGLSNGLMSHGFEKQIHRLDTVLLEDDQDMEEDIPVGMLENDIDDSLQKEIRSPTSPTVELSKELGTSAHKVQLMKASFFADDLISAEYMDAVAYSDAELLKKEVDKYAEGTLDQEAVPKLSKSFPIFRTQFSAQEPSPKYTAIAVKGTTESSQIQIAPVPSGIWMHPPVVKPKIAVLKHQGQVIPLEKSSVGHLSARCAADLGLMLGRSFRVGWGKRSTLLTLNTQKAAAVMPLHSELSSLNLFLWGRVEGDCSQSIVQRLQLSGGGYSTSSTFMESVEDHLKVQLKYCVRKIEDGCPSLSPQSGADALHAHCVAAENLASLSLNDRTLEYSSEVWNLCVALWGSLPDLEESSLLHHKTMVRRLAVSEWLQNVVDQKVQKEVAALSESSKEEEPHIPVVFSLLTGRKINEACQRMQEAGDHYAAMLLSQVSSGSVPRQLMQHQLSSWHEVEADSFIYRERLKLLMLVAGIPLLESSHGTINVCENLDWKRAFAIHLWYMCSPISSVTDALYQYENAFGPPESVDAYARLPDPPYLQEGIEPEISSGLKVYDLCFHLLKLYSSRAHSLEQLLNPATHTADPLDYRLSWFLQQVLNALGYTHNSEHSESMIHMSFASQLESQGQWHWAVFILLHLKDITSIKTAIFDLLGRNVELSDDPDYIAKEEFLCNDLKIPAEWIYEAKATLASAHGRHRDRAFYLIKAGQWQKSHEVLMEHIASDAIVNENYDYLRELLASLVPPERCSTIPSWNSRGQLLWDYLKMIAELESLLANQATDKIASYQLEKLQPQLSSLCSRINFLPCPTAMDRLCQSEIAKRTVHVVRSMLLLQNGQDAGLSRVLTYLVTQLPLPEDYAQQELRQVVSSCIAEFH